MIKNLLFDLGGVLIDLDVNRSIMAFENLLDNSLSHLPVTAMDLLGGGESQLIQKYQTGDISTEEFVNTILSVCKPNTTRQQVEQAWFAMLLSLPEHRLQRLRDLKEKGFGVYILSNINELHVDWTLEHFEKWGITAKGRENGKHPSSLSKVCLDGVFFSNEIHCAKPDRMCYEYVIEKTGICPEETLYIDDLEQNISAGQMVGFQCFRAMGDEWLPRIDKIIKER